MGVGVSGGVVAVDEAEGWLQATSTRHKRKNQRRLLNIGVPSLRETGYILVYPAYVIIPSNLLFR
jgi:hypothetical protein